MEEVVAMVLVHPDVVAVVEEVPDSEVVAAEV